MFTGTPGYLLQLYLFALTCDATGGLVVASVLKHLDNIVKEYSGAAANVLTAVSCAQLFPEEFAISPIFCLSLTFLGLGIYLYERGRLNRNK